MKRCAVLACHPATPCGPVRRFAVGVRERTGGLALEYRVEGDIDALSIAQPGLPQRADGLWQNTCFEAFIKGQGDEYCEFNFAPSAAWAAYRFTAYRQGMAVLENIEPVQIATYRDAHRFDLEALLNLDPWPMPDKGGCLLLGLSAVIQDRHGGVSYWAYAHAKGKPDFHHPDSFAFEFGLGPASFSQLQHF